MFVKSLTEREAKDFGVRPGNLPTYMVIREKTDIDWPRCAPSFSEVSRMFKT